MEKHHEYLYKQVETLYYFLADRVPVRQDGILKTYLWSASLSLALNISLLPKLEGRTVWITACGFSLLSGFCTLVYALNTLRGNPKDDLKSPDLETYLSYLENPDYDNPLLARMVATDMAEELRSQSEIHSSRGRRLREMSFCLTLSFALLAIASGGCIFK